MNNLSNKITAYLGSKPDFNKEVKLQDDMVDGVSNPYIAEWNITEKPKPTDAELNALESEADKIQNNSGVISTRKKLYGTTAEQLEYIVENGVSAFIEKQQQIKISNPKE